MDSNRLSYLLEKYQSDTATDEEITELSRYFRENDDPEIWDDLISARLATFEEEAHKTSPRFDNLALKALQIDKSTTQRRSIRRYTWIAAAAATLLLIAGTVWYTIYKPVNKQPIAQTTTNIGPGKSGAILTLSDGSQIALDSLHNGIIATQAGAAISLNKGQLSYDNNGKNQLAYNTMATPKGRQFSLSLPDGTTVWLNSASSIRFPTSFGPDSREVSITGEAYFEVAKNTRPFNVKISEQTSIAVLGTSFNINTYNNEPTTNATLIEGKIKVITGKNELLLQPGQAAMIDQQRTIITKATNVNIEKVVAWKNGLFNFNGSTLQEVMKQLERWYDIEVTYQGNIPATKFYGEMEMNMPLKNVLDILGTMGIHYRLEGGNKLIVTP